MRKDMDLSNIPFIVENRSKSVTTLTMIRDVNFSLKAKIDGLVKFKIYLVPKQEGPIYNTTSYLIKNRSNKYKSILKIGVIVSEMEDMVLYPFNDRAYELRLWQHKMENNEMYLSNPELIINTEFLESLIK